MTGGEHIAKLASRVRVRPHVRVRKGKLVPVEGYVRAQDVLTSVVQDDTEVFVTVRSKKDPLDYSILVLEQDALERDSREVYAVTNVSTSKSRGKGMATQAAMAFHERYPGVWLRHGAFATRQGAEWAKFLIEAYPEWNFSWEDIDKEIARFKRSGENVTVPRRELRERQEMGRIAREVGRRL